MHNSLGLYVHVPFCQSKCGYCDFYSLCDGNIAGYVKQINNQLKIWGGQAARPIDTLYFGGGTPSVLGTQLAEIIEIAKQSFSFKNAEITVEANPADRLDEFFTAVRDAGANRLSLGVQSAIEEELRLLGRRHSFDDARATVAAAKKCGFDNISLDIMLGIPNQTEQSLKKTLECFFELEPNHISAYMLKIEKGTPFFKMRDSLNLPSDDQTADFYLYTVEQMEKQGYKQYEISNFAKEGKYSRHNLKYWNCDEYLGFGPSAHSFFEGHRFYYPQSLTKYIENPSAIPDGQGGSPEEYAMLRLRLCEGIAFEEFYRRFGRKPSQSFLQKAKKYAENGFCCVDSKGVRLTKKGFLVSNTVIGGLYENI